MEARREASVEKVREVNSRFAKQVAALLPKAPGTVGPCVQGSVLPMCTARRRQGGP